MNFCLFLEVLWNLKMLLVSINSKLILEKVIFCFHYTHTQRLRGLWGFKVNNRMKDKPDNAIYTTLEQKLILI